MSVAPFSSDDEALVSTFVRLERKSRDAVPMTDMVIAGKYLHCYFYLLYRLFFLTRALGVPLVSDIFLQKNVS